MTLHAEWLTAVALDALDHVHDRLDGPLGWAGVSPLLVAGYDAAWGAFTALLDDSRRRRFNDAHELAVPA